ncbi:flavoprotein [Durotheca rogersii]|uniref:flavoprotein n=1 Tax=Durotheca rogersii TaxID=419775 RepID=UPI00221E5BB8|nr:flavoprotein [Durotheca rogersii]KAI5858246.1 flavoprotein [Durotheca rogersii]
MLQAISSAHDPHHERRRKNSLVSLSAALLDGKTHLLLAASGSAATVKLPLIVEALGSRHQQRRRQQSDGSRSKDLSIRIILTPAATRFLAGQSADQPPVSALLSLPCVDGVYVDADEWREPWKRGDAVMHIELRRWAHLLAIAPLSADAMAKIVGGFADSLLTSVVRAWDPWSELDILPPSSSAATAASASTETQQPPRRRRKKRILVACAVNIGHPVTTKHLRVLEEEWGVKPQPPIPTAHSDDASAAGPQKEAREGTGGEAEDEGDGWFEVLRPRPADLAAPGAADVGGDGAMRDWRDVVAIIEDRLRLLE